MIDTDEFHGYRIRFRVSGQFMCPTIRNGDWVVVQGPLPRGPRRGDIVLRQGVRGLSVLRVIDTWQNLPSPDQDGQPSRHILLQGDAPGSIEEIAAAEQIKGRVVAVERNSRRNLLTALNPLLRYQIKARVSRLRQSLDNLGLASNRY